MCGVGFALDLVSRDAQTFPLAKKSLKGFTRKAPEPSRDPPPYKLVWLLGTLKGRRGMQAAAALTLLAADAYLRPSEALALRAGLLQKIEGPRGALVRGGGVAGTGHPRHSGIL